MSLAKLAFLLLFTLSFVLPGSTLAQEFPPPEPLTPTVVNDLTRQRKPHPRQRRELLQQRLQQMGDAPRSALVLRINDKLTDINNRVTLQMTDSLNRISQVLDRLKTRLDTATADGRDTAAAQQAFADAQAGLTQAQDAVANQAALDVTLDASDPAQLRPSVGRAVSQLNADLHAIKRLIIEAKHRVSKLISELAKTGVGKIGQRGNNTASGPALMEPLIGQ